MRKSPVVTLALVVAFGLVSSQDAQATNYRDFCSAVPGECDYSGPDAPVLDRNVCWSRSTATATLMTGATCPTGSYPYAVKYGFADPGSKIVTAFVPLDDACTRPGLCVPGSFAPPNTTSAPMCCIGGTCWPIEGTNSCEAGELLYCSNGVSNEDGTVTCFDEVLG